jgi:hypothetical protein
MRKVIVIGAMCLVGTFGAAMAGPGGHSTGLVPIPQTSEASAAIGRGGGGGSEGSSEGGSGGSALQVFPRLKTLAGTAIASLLFVITGAAIGVAAMQRNMGFAVVAVVLSMVIGAFVLAPDQVEAWFKSIYQFVL